MISEGGSALYGVLRMVTKAKQAERDADIALATQTISKAKSAAALAAAEFSKSANRTKDGHIADARGGASVVIYKPSYRLRTALQALGEIKKGHGGAWHVSNFTEDVTSQSITKHEKACGAACAVLRAAYPSEEQFYATSNMT